MNSIRLTKLAPLSLVAAITIAGCGGGMTSSLAGGNATDPGSTMAVGSIMASGEIRQQLNTTLTGGATVYSLTGNLTHATFNDLNPSLEETELVYARSGPEAYEIMAITPQGTGRRRICTTGQGVTNVLVSPKADFVYYVESSTIKKAPMAGGSPVTVLAGVHSFAFNKDASAMLIQKQADKAMYTCNPDGTAMKKIYPLQDYATMIALQPNYVCYAAPTYYGYVSINAGSSSVYVAGGTVKNVCVSPNFETAYMQVDSTWRMFSFGPYGMTDRTLNTNVSRDAGDMACSPGSPMLAGIDPQHAGSQSVFTTDLNRGASTVIAESYGNGSIDWAPFVTKRTLIGEGNYLSAGALIFCEKGNFLPSAVWADAANRASITLTKISDDNAANAVYRLDCDDLTKLHFTKSANMAQEEVVSAPAGIRGALISFDSYTGKVTTIAPFTSQPMVKRMSGGLYVDSASLVKVVTADEKKPMTQNGMIRL